MANIIVTGCHSTYRPTMLLRDVTVLMARVFVRVLCVHRGERHASALRGVSLKEREVVLRSRDGRCNRSHYHTSRQGERGGEENR